MNEKTEHALEQARTMFRLYENSIAHMGRPAGGGLCVPAAVITGAMCFRNDIRCYICAGTARFRIVHPDNDDGSSSTHLEFRYGEEVPESGLFRPDGIMTEIHSWAVVVDDDSPSTGGGQLTMEDIPNAYLVDWSAPGIPNLCRELVGLDWDREMPTPLPVIPMQVVPAFAYGQYYQPIEDACIRLVECSHDVLATTMKMIVEAAASGMDMEGVNITIMEVDS